MKTKPLSINLLSLTPSFDTVTSTGEIILSAIARFRVEGAGQGSFGQTLDDYLDSLTESNYLTAGLPASAYRNLDELKMAYRGGVASCPELVSAQMTMRWDKLAETGSSKSTGPRLSETWRWDEQTAFSLGGSMRTGNYNTAELRCTDASGVDRMSLMVQMEKGVLLTAYFEPKNWAYYTAAYPTSVIEFSMRLQDMTRRRQSVEVTDDQLTVLAKAGVPFSTR